MSLASSTRHRLRAEAAIDWLGLAYRGLFLALVAAPVWGAALALAILWLKANP